jgi:hypothetical protein
VASRGRVLVTHDVSTLSKHAWRRTGLGGHLKTGHHGRDDRDRQLLIESWSSGLLSFSLSPRRVLAVRMWESRVRCEISKARWKPCCGFHGAVICIAIFSIRDRADRGGCCTLAGLPIVVPRKQTPRSARGPVTRGCKGRATKRHGQTRQLQEESSALGPMTLDS